VPGCGVEDFFSEADEGEYGEDCFRLGRANARAECHFEVSADHPGSDSS
jgi:hypothetical protein